MLTQLYRLAASCSTALVIILALSGSSTYAADAPSAIIRGSGCVEAGVEAGCRILRDPKTHEVFNLFFKNAGPAVDTAIAFQGTETDNPNFCMQGKPVEVTSWHPIRLHCPRPGAHAAAATDAGTSPSPCGKWAAWYNMQPGASRTLHVSGVCTFNDNGYAVSLARHTPPGVNVNVLQLDLTITPPAGKVSHLVRNIPVEFSEVTNVQPQSVEILPDHVSIPVKIVQ